MSLGVCAVCDEPAVQRCSVCKVVYYCNSDHQHQDWSSHRKECAPPVTDVSTYTLGGQLVDTDKEQRNINKQLAKSAQLNKKGESKAIPSIYHHKKSPADNAAKRAIVHHAGSHYHMAGSKQYQKGVRVQGVISRHSKQGARVQAAARQAQQKKKSKKKKKKKKNK